MAIFNYSARDRSGVLKQDRLEGPSREAVVATLRAQGLLPLSIVEQKAAGDSESAFSLNPFDYQAIHAYDIEHEFHQIAVMLRSGISLLDALNLTAKHCRIGARKTWLQLARRIQQGSSFHEALAEHKAFSQFTIQLVKVGEQTGYLSTVMDQAAIEIKAARKLRDTLFTALRYPAFTLLIAIGIVIFMLVKLVPEIKKLLKIMGKKMPPITQALIDTSDWVLAHGLGLTLGLMIVVATLGVFYQLPKSRWWMDRMALRLPIFGAVFRLSGTVLFARAMGLLLRSGVVIVEGLATMEKLHRNRYLASLVGDARERVMLGSSLAEPLSAKFGYMPLLLQMIRVGENAGTLDEILIEMTAYHDELLERRIATLTGMIAPMMTIIVGGIVGFVYAAFLVAMFAAAGGSPK